jgi:hypothetical protein
MISLTVPSWQPDVAKTVNSKGSPDFSVIDADGVTVGLRLKIIHDIID